MNKNASQYELSIFGNLVAAKANLPESQFQEMLKSIFEDMKQTFDFEPENARATEGGKKIEN